MNKLKSGFVTVVGRPNAGKSTLLNHILGEKVSIVSDIPQTTRYPIRGILNLKKGQAVFVDTPGIHLFKYKLSSVLNMLAFSSLKGVEAILYVVDCSRSPQAEENKIMGVLQKQDIPIIMVLNKIDKTKKYLADYIELWNEKNKGKLYPLKYFVPVSALTGKNLEELIESVFEILPNGEPFYSEKIKTDFPLFYRVTDIIREKLCILLKEELPYKTAVEVTNVDTEGKIAEVYANILVSEKSHKQIVVGKKGEKIKEIGKQARLDLERLLKKKVFLKTWVKVEKDWQDKPRILRELGYTGL